MFVLFNINENITKIMAGQRMMTNGFRPYYLQETIPLQLKRSDIFKSFVVTLDINLCNL